ncbi:MAG: hypothetical protein ACMXYG_07590 [Candidatus Woesearchaeota archaeon]
MTSTWYKKKGFKKNPLTIEPSFDDKLFGYDGLLKELTYRIEAGNVIFIEGKTSKTSLLLKIIKRYQGYGRVAYVNCKNIPNEPDIKLLLSKGRKINSKELEKFPKNMIILLDNVSFLSNANAEKIKFFFDQGIILSIIMTSIDYSATKIPESLRHRVGNRIYKLRDLTFDEKIDIIREKLNFGDLIELKYIKNIAEQEKEIKSIIELCDSALFIMNNEGKEVIDDNIIQKVLKK